MSRTLRIDEAVAVVIVNYRTPALTAACLASLEKERLAFRDLVVVVVDGGSGDESVDELSASITQHGFGDWVDLLPLPVNGGYGWANNQAIQRLMRKSEPPKYVHVLNPDTKIEAGAVSRLAEYLNTHLNAAAVGSQLLEPDGSWTGSAFSFPSIGGEFSRGSRTAAVDRLFKIPPISIKTSEPMEVDWVSGASVMFRVDALREVGLFDEGFFLYHEEIELMWRLRKAGWAVATEPRSRVRHIGGGATGVYGGETTSPMRPRKPAYLYRSRTRLFGLTRGRISALLAFTAWLGGHGVWRLRRLIGIESGPKVDHELRDHLQRALPRRHDFVSAAPRLDANPTTSPVWMERRWL